MRLIPIVLLGLLGWPLWAASDDGLALGHTPVPVVLGQSPSDPILVALPSSDEPAAVARLLLSIDPGPRPPRKLGLIYQDAGRPLADGGLRLWHLTDQIAGAPGWERPLHPGRQPLNTFYRAGDAADAPLLVVVEVVPGRRPFATDPVLTLVTATGGAKRVTTIPFAWVRVDLDADTDRNGRIDLADNTGEGRWQTGTTGRGAIILPNCDRDGDPDGPPDNWIGGDWNLDGTVDEREVPDSRIGGSADLADVGRLMLHRLGRHVLPSGLTVRLRLEPVEPRLHFPRAWFEETFWEEEGVFWDDDFAAACHEATCDGRAGWEDETARDADDRDEHDAATDDDRADEALAEERPTDAGPDPDDEPLASRHAVPDDEPVTVCPDCGEEIWTDAEAVTQFDARSHPVWLLDRPVNYRLRLFWPSIVDSAGGRLAGDEASIIGPEHGDASWTAPTDQLHGEGALELGVEGLAFGAYADVICEVLQGDRLVGSDRVRLRVAPFALADHRQPVGDDALEVAWVHVNHDGENNQELRETLCNIYGDDRVAQPPLMDLWHQDGYEVGYVQAPYGSMPVVLELGRGMDSGDGDSLQTFLRQEVISPGVGICADIARLDYGRSHDAGGNIESMPLQAGPGSFVYGQSMSRMLVAFFAIQGVNPVRPVDTDWLNVGHIDEVVSFTPHRTAAVADPETALALLALARQSDPTVALRAVVDESEGWWRSDDWFGGDHCEEDGPQPDQGEESGDEDTAGREPVDDTDESTDEDETSGRAEPGTLDEEGLLIVNEQDLDGYGTSLRDYNLAISQDDDKLAGITAQLGLKRYAGIPRAHAANRGDAGLLRAGALIAWLPTTAPRRQYRLLFTDSETFAISYRAIDADGQAGPWEAGGSGRRDTDCVDPQSLFFCFPEWWDDGVPEAGDRFTVTVRTRPRAVPVPVLFRPADDLAQSLTANAANCIIDGHLAIVARPTGPVVDWRERGRPGDIFADYVRAAFKRMGMQHVVLLDDRAYHTHDGSLHCGTNFIRRVPETPWWLHPAPEVELPFDDEPDEAEPADD